MIDESTWLVSERFYRASAFVKDMETWSNYMLFPYNNICGLRKKIKGIEFMEIFILLILLTACGSEDVNSLTDEEETPF